MIQTKTNINNQPIYKIILIGSANTGKTTFCQRITDIPFNETYLSTIGIDFHIKSFQLNDKKSVRLQIWDTAGSERYRSISKMYYKGSHIVLACFDLTNMDSLLDLPSWLSELKIILTEHNVMIVLVGMKSDLTENRIKQSMINEFIENNCSINGGYYEISSKNEGEHLDEIVRTILTVYQKNYRKLTEASHWKTGKNTEDILDLISENKSSTSTNQNHFKNCCRTQ